MEQVPSAAAAPPAANDDEAVEIEAAAKQQQTQPAAAGVSEYGAEEEADYDEVWINWVEPAEGIAMRGRGWRVLHVLHDFAVVTTRFLIYSCRN